jgi:hypothetical protein
MVGRKHAAAAKRKAAAETPTSSERYSPYPAPTGGAASNSAAVQQKNAAAVQQGKYVLREKIEKTRKEKKEKTKLEIYIFLRELWRRVEYV